jgi:hypothetical protein
MPNAKFDEQRLNGRGQRLTNTGHVEPRSLEQRHTLAAQGKPTCSCGARRPGTDDCDVEV